MLLAAFLLNVCLPHIMVTTNEKTRLPSRVYFGTPAILPSKAGEADDALRRSRSSASMGNLPGGTGLISAPISPPQDPGLFFCLNFPCTVLQSEQKAVLPLPTTSFQNVHARMVNPIRVRPCVIDVGDAGPLSF